MNLIIRANVIKKNCGVGLIANVVQIACYDRFVWPPIFSTHPCGEVKWW